MALTKHTEGGTRTTTLSEKQIESLSRLYAKHFGD